MTRCWTGTSKGEDLGFETIETALLTAVANASFHPVIPLSVTPAPASTCCCT